MLVIFCQLDSEAYTQISGPSAGRPAKTTTMEGVSMTRTLALLLAVFLLSSTSVAYSDDDDRGRKGLNRQAKKELVAAGVNKYLGDFKPVASVPFGDGWTKHTFDPDSGAGPLCIAGTPYSVFTKKRNPKKLLIFMQGGGACWQDFYFCNVLSEAQEPPPAFFLNGIFDESMPDNPLDDYSIAYLPYCDGSVFSGDNDVVDANFPFGPVRFHRGLRNASAGIDVAKAVFPKAKRIVLAGSSAGGVGVSGFAPFLVRMTFGNRKQLRVFNDAGPVAVNLLDVGGVAARAADWQFAQFYPVSCTLCSAFAQGTEIIKWRLANDRSIREAFYSTDADTTNRGFLFVPTQALYRALILSEHGAINALFPDRYKRFIRSGDEEHTALQLPQFYSYEIDGVPLVKWTADFLKPRKCSVRDRDDDDDEDDDDDDDDDDDRPKRKNCSWVDLVEDFIPVP